MTEILRLALAYDAAARAHAGVTYGDGIPYLTHPVAVARLVAESGGTPEAVVAAVLHDVIEHGDMTLLDVEAGFGADVAGLVDLLSNLPAWAELPKPEKKARQAERIAGAPEAARRIRLADQIMNLSDHVEGVEVAKPKKLRQYLAGAQRIAAACAGVSDLLDARFALVAGRLEADLREAGRSTGRASGRATDRRAAKE